MAARDVGRLALAELGSRRRDPVDPLDRPRRTLVDATVELVHAIGHADVPLVIVVDDAHDADESLVSLLGRLFDGPMCIPTLVVTTASLQRLRLGISASTSGPFGSWLDGAAARLPTNVARVEAARLDDDAMAALVREAHPACDGEVVDAFVERADGNPLVLQDLLGLERVRRSARAREAGLAPSEVAHLPNSHGSILEERWRDLPDAVRHALVVRSGTAGSLVRARAAPE